MHHQKFPVNLAKEAEKIFADGFDPNLPSEKVKAKTKEKPKKAKRIPKRELKEKELEGMKNRTRTLRPPAGRGGRTS